MIKNQRNNLLEVLEALEKSPIFHFSLSSKELFHSNFLYWLADAYPKQFGKIFLSLLGLNKDCSTIKNIKREKGNIDLSFEFIDGESVFIENKVKSIPNENQLERYSKKFKNNKNFKLILLSLSTPEFFKGKDNKIINSINWTLISYKQLNEELEKCQLDNQYHQSLLNDYLVLINALLQINDTCNLKEDNLFDFHADKSDYLKKLRELRMHDFYLKKMYEIFSMHIYKKLCDNFPNLKLLFAKKLDANNLARKIYIHHGMTQATGLVDIKYHIIDDIALGIQIQGQSYKMLVECNKNYADQNKNRLFKLAELLHEEDLWFHFKDSSVSGHVIYPLKDKKFNKYGDVFRYKSVKLGTDKTIKEITDLIIKDFKHIDDNYNEIQKQIIKYA